MPKSFKLLLIAVLLMAAAGQALANVNAIKLKEIKYPTSLQGKIDFLVENQDIYNHWVHDWNTAIPKTTVVNNLTALYKGISAIPNKNLEANLLLGDIAHYLYNMENEAYYQIAINNYQAAIKMAPNDYRGYWFLGNHYALAANELKGMANYKLAFNYLPKPAPSDEFWADYSVACANAAMPGSAVYAAHQVSVLKGHTMPVENQIRKITSSMLSVPPADTTIKDRDLWATMNPKGNLMSFNSYQLGIKVRVDPDAQLQIGGYENHLSYITIKPKPVITSTGKKIGFNILMMAQVKHNDSTLNQWLNKMTAYAKTRKPINWPVAGISNTIGYDIHIADAYKEYGGAQIYAIALERDVPEFPGYLLDEPTEIPKDNKSGKGKMVYYRQPQKYTRFHKKIYYLFLLDSCEAINQPSTKAFKDFLANLVIE